MTVLVTCPRAGCVSTVPVTTPITHRGAPASAAPLDSGACCAKGSQTLGDGLPYSRTLLCQAVMWQGGKSKVVTRGAVPTNNPLEQEGAPVAPLLLFLEELEAGAGAGQEHPEALRAEKRLS